MINYDNLSNIDINTNEGQLLISALAILTSLDKQDIDDKKWGGWTHPDKALRQVVDLANRLYHEKEYSDWKKTIERDDKIKNVLNEK